MLNESKPPVFTIAEFCADHRISRTTLHYLTKAGKGPRLMAVGKRVYVTNEAAADWRRQREIETSAALESVSTPAPSPSSPSREKPKGAMPPCVKARPKATSDGGAVL